MLAVVVVVVLLVCEYHATDAAAAAAKLELTSLIKPKQEAQGGVLSTVQSVWDSVVANNQFGLTDPKQPMNLVALSREEAFYHYSASQRGAVDSARFLLTFGIATDLADLQHSKFYRAVLANDIAGVESMLEQDDSALSSQIAQQFPLHVLATVFNRREITRLVLTAGIIHVEATPNHGATALMVAACVNNVEMIEDLVKLGLANVNAQHAFAKTSALHFAAEMGHVEAMRVLVKLGANVELTTKLGGTALHTATDANKVQAVQWLLREGGANANALLNGDTTALYLAAQRGYADMLTALLSWNETVVDMVMPSTRFAGGAAASSLAVVGGQSARGSYYESKNTEVGNGATALHVASENGHLECVHRLLSLGKAKQLNSMRGSTPLLIALQYRHERIALRLLEGGAQAAQCNVSSPLDGAFPLFVAAGNGYAQCVARLLELGCDVTLRNKHGASALSHALFRNHVQVARQLIDADASVMDEIALQAAAESRNAAMFAHLYSGKRFPEFPLLDRNVLQILRKTRGDLSPFTRAFYIACQDGNLDWLRALLDVWKESELNRATSELSDEYQVTALYLASEKGHDRVVQLLLERGADVNLGLRYSKTSSSASPLQIASERAHESVVRVLLAYAPEIGPREIQAAAISASSLRILQLLCGEDLRLIKLALRTSLQERRWDHLPWLASKKMDAQDVVPELLRLILSLAEEDGKEDLDVLRALELLLVEGWEQVELDFTLMHAAVIAYSNAEAGEEYAERLVRVLLLLLRRGSGSGEAMKRMLGKKTIKTGFTPIMLAVEAGRDGIASVLTVYLQEEDSEISLDEL